MSFNQIHQYPFPLYFSFKGATFVKQGKNETWPSRVPEKTRGKQPSLGTSQGKSYFINLSNYVNHE